MPYRYCLRCWFVALRLCGLGAASDFFLQPCSRVPDPLSLLFPLLVPPFAPVRAKGQLRFAHSNAQSRSRSFIVVVSVAGTLLCFAFPIATDRSFASGSAELFESDGAKHCPPTSVRGSFLERDDRGPKDPKLIEKKKMYV